jgi:uncharacterized protein (DUF3820 family)
MNMEEQLLPIVPFGKYKDKSVLELLADEKYVEWLKQTSWFSNHKQIYNIVVHQTIHTTNNSKTPEHNKLQNLFLDKNNQVKLLSKLFKVKINEFNNLFLDEDIVRCFGEILIPKFINNVDNTSIKFEDKFNWDLVLYYRDIQNFTITSNLETELFDKNKYKEQYDIEENEKHENNLLLIDELIKARIKLDQEGINKYDETMKEYLDKCEKYENDLKIYLQQKPQNDKDISNYEKKLNIYQTKRDNFTKDQTKLICQELGINYDYFVNWDIKNNGYSHLDRDTKHTTEEKKQLQEIVNDKLKPFIEEFEGMNTRPKFVGKLNIPTKPPSPQKYNKENDIRIGKEDDEIFKLLEKCKKILDMSMGYLRHYFISADKLNKHKKDYENKYKKDYENNFNNHYEKYRLQYYRDIIKKYCNENVYVDKINDNQYKISVRICNYYNAVCCELKPTLSDDYPVVLRKLKTQIELTQNDKTNFEDLKKKYILIIGNFTSIYVSKEQLITIFKQSNIKIIFTDEIFETSKSVAIKCENANTTTNAEQALFENKLIEENKVITDNLLQTQQKLLQAEEKIKQLEEEIQSLKTQKQSKSIKAYFVKK